MPSKRGSTKAEKAGKAGGGEGSKGWWRCFKKREKRLSDVNKDKGCIPQWMRCIKLRGRVQKQEQMLKALGMRHGRYLRLLVVDKQVDTTDCLANSVLTTVRVIK